MEEETEVVETHVLDRIFKRIFVLLFGSITNKGVKPHI